MIGNCFFAATAVFMGIALYVVQECTFLIPYKSLLFGRYAGAMGAFAALLFLNVFALVHVVVRKLFLKDTGEKLAHVEKQIRSGSSISEELSRRLEE
jgi:hypothetical protein